MEPERRAGCTIGGPARAVNREATGAHRARDERFQQDTFAECESFTVGAVTVFFVAARWHQSPIRRNTTPKKRFQVRLRHRYRTGAGRIELPWRVCRLLFARAEPGRFRPRGRGTLATAQDNRDGLSQRRLQARADRRENRLSHATEKTDGRD